MSDTASSSDGPVGAPPAAGGWSLLRCCCAFALALLLLIALAVGYTVYALNSMRATEPLAFAPVEPRPFEHAELASRIEAYRVGERLELLEAGAALDQRDLNVFLFHERPQTEEEKVRVELEGDALRVLSSQRREDGTYLNIDATCGLSLQAGHLELDLRRAKVGDYELPGLSRWLFRRLLLPTLQEKVAADPDLAHVDSLEIRDGVVHIRWSR